MGNPRARYTLEFKLEAVRMVKGGQSLAAVAKILDIRPQTLHNWIKAEQQGRLGGAGSPAVSAEQMEIARVFRSSPPLRVRGIYFTVLQAANYSMNL